MGKLNLILGFHAHQPVGNFEWVFEEAYEKSYKPFLDIIEKHPRIKATFHYSGCLIEWLSKSKKEFLKRLKALVKSGQIEMLGGGYYEPILTLISDEDKSGQLQLMRESMKKHFGAEPKGIWLTERIWEPQLAQFLAREGIKYTIVDDSHFRRAGIAEEKALGYYITEDSGYNLNIFPTLEKLRYMIPFKLPGVAIDYLRANKDLKGAFVIADDMEKFGLWPGTHKWVYEDGWLDSFFKALEENSSWIETVTFSEYMADNPPLGRIYLPCGSYKEMDEWSGGYFKNFLVKYPESNHLHKKMMYLSGEIKELYSKEKKSETKNALACARDYIYRAQCNDVYWHGVFGGLYLNHLRYAAYNNLLEARAAMDSACNISLPNVRVLDIDKDGYEDVIVETKSLGLIVDLDNGGSISELDYKPARLNLINTISRRQESYHAKLREPQGTSVVQANSSPATIHESSRPKEEGLAEYLNYDWYKKTALIDHFMPQDTSYESFSKCKYAEIGDFVNMPYASVVKSRKQDKATRGLIELSRNGNIYEGEPQPINITKTIEFSNEPQLEIKYVIKNSSNKLLKALFGVEFNFSLKDPHFNQPGSVQGMKRIDINDQWFGVRLDFVFGRPAGLWYFPIETVSESESGIERTYQEITFFFNWKLELSPGSAWKTDFTIEAGER